MERHEWEMCNHPRLSSKKALRANNRTAQVNGWPAPRQAPVMEWSVLEKSANTSESLN